MQLISGPSKDAVFGMAQEYADVAIAIWRMQQEDEAAQADTAARLTAAGAPTALPELVDRAADYVRRGKLGWYRRNQFFGGILGFCMLSGMPRDDARYLVKLIRGQLTSG